MSKSPKVQLIELQQGGVPFEELVTRRRQQKHSYRQIAAELGCNHVLVHRWARRLGIDGSPKASEELKETANSR